MSSVSTGSSLTTSAEQAPYTLIKMQVSVPYSAFAGLGGGGSQCSLYYFPEVEQLLSSVSALLVCSIFVPLARRNRLLLELFLCFVFFFFSPMPLDIPSLLSSSNPSLEYRR